MPRARKSSVAGLTPTSKNVAALFMRREEKLDGWLEEAEACIAVRAELTETWSNGPVEGFVHKLKLLKRQGYGRAGFDLLRARMLVA